MPSNPTDRRDFLRRTLALSGVLIGSPQALPGRPPGHEEVFAEIRGNDRVRELLEDAFSIYSGRTDGNTLSKLVVTNSAGTKSFVNDNVLVEVHRLPVQLSRDLWMAALL